MVSGGYASLAPRLSLTHPNPEAVLDLLLGLGFLGVRLNGADEFVFKYYGEQGNAFRSIDEIAEITIHPAFRAALGLRKSTTGRDEVAVREAADDDLVAASAAVAIRSIGATERATELIAALRRFPLEWEAFGDTRS